MIVCQCNVISEREIEEAIFNLLDDDSWQLIVPVQVYHALGKRGRCFGCFPNVVDIIVRATEGYHRRSRTPDAKITSHLDWLRDEHRRLGTDRGPDGEGAAGRNAA